MSSCALSKRRSGGPHESTKEKASVPAAAELEVRVDVKFLLDRIALLGEVRVFPCEVIHRVERERLEPGVARAEQREAMVHRRIDDASAANESARGEEILIYADDVVQKAEPLAIAIERRLPERRLRCPVLEEIVRRTASRRLKVERVEFTKHERSIDIGDAIGPSAVGAIGVRGADV